MGLSDLFNGLTLVILLTLHQRISASPVSKAPKSPESHMHAKFRGKKGRGEALVSGFLSFLSGAKVRDIKVCNLS